MLLKSEYVKFEYSNKYRGFLLTEYLLNGDVEVPCCHEGYTVVGITEKAKTIIQINREKQFNLFS